VLRRESTISAQGRCDERRGFAPTILNHPTPFVVAGPHLDYLSEDEAGGSDEIVTAFRSSQDEEDEGDGETGNDEEEGGVEWCTLSLGYRPAAAVRRPRPQSLARPEADRESETHQTQQAEHPATLLC
jgi:hypothetical protein